MELQSITCSLSNVVTLFWCASLLLSGWFPTDVVGIATKGRQLPPSLGNVSSLQEISLKWNRLEGRLPVTLGLLKRLVALELNGNNFSGSIPPSFCNMSSLEYLVLGNNQLSGILPVCLGSNLPSLRGIFVGANNLSGTLPESLSNVSNLEMLEVSDNYFSGKVSVNFLKARDLNWMNMKNNNLGSGSTGDLDFVTTLTNCSGLQVVSIAFNQFSGLLPNSITNLSVGMNHLYFGNNQITGTIPLGITNLVNLLGIGFEYNQLTGTIPDSIGKLKTLQWLSLGGNALTGRIPTSVGNLSRLNVFGLEENLLEGNIPAGLGKCQNLMKMGLQSNRLTGEFSGQIPAALGGCTSLEFLYLGNNHFSGSIPASLSSLRSIAEFDLSNNNLSGQIPEYLEKLPFLSYLNLSYNQFEGQVPTGGVFSNATTIALPGNEKLCGGIAELQLPFCRFLEPKEGKRRLPLKLILIVCGVVGVLMLSSAILSCWSRKKGVKPELSSTSPFGASILMVSFQQLLKATDGFAPTNLIGQGSFGNVYRGILDQNEERNAIAVKPLNNFSGNSTSTSHGLKGTVGYVAPEYGNGTEATTSGDMYSFGILLLEIFTRKRPTDETFKDELTLHVFAKTALPDRVLEVVDPLLVVELEYNRNQEASSSRNPRRENREATIMKECLVSIFKVGIACSVESAQDRMDIVDATKELHFIRNKLLGAGIRTRREAHV
ncbi:EF-TU receptor [Hibiscus trionum]|uniref:non-specific serine/threonine protein kinase n=1 Tax=Hibiscus trionum TaxID=183268 RepID=A0A9W7LQ15_HIBTR|nr:EF-TU receptor [Hibiscus trionum]